MTVYVLMRSYDMSDFTDYHGDCAGEKDFIVAIFDSEEKAQKAMVQQQKLEEEESFPAYFRIDRWRVF